MYLLCASDLLSLSVGNEVVTSAPKHPRNEICTKCPKLANPQELKQVGLPSPSLWRQIGNQGL